MPANWSLILNILLLIGVIVAIGRLMKARRESLSIERYQPNTVKVNSPYDSQPMHDDIIAVRKVKAADELVLSAQPEPALDYGKAPPKKAAPQLLPQEEPVVEKVVEKVRDQEKNHTSSSTLMMFLLAKENRHFAGYELLQTLLASGLRFGEGHLFHRHQFSNGQGPILCSLASATATGVFDLQNIGAFSVRGLCLFMQVSKDAQINAERFSVMLETGKQLSEGLNAHLLDEQRKPLTAERIAGYYRMLNIEQEEHEYV